MRGAKALQLRNKLKFVIERLKFAGIRSDYLDILDEVSGALDREAFECREAGCGGFSDPQENMRHAKLGFKGE